MGVPFPPREALPLLAEVFRQGATGLLRVGPAHDSLRVALRRGSIVGLRPGPEPALEAPPLPEPDGSVRLKLERVLAQVGVALTTGRRTRPPRDAAALRERLLELLSGDDEADFEETEAIEEDLNPAVGATEPLILEAVSRRAEKGNSGTLLGDLDRPLVIVTPSDSDRTLTRPEAALVAQVDGAATARVVMRQAPVDPNRAERELAGLLLTGRVAHRSQEAPRTLEDLVPDAPREAPPQAEASSAEDASTARRNPVAHAADAPAETPAPPPPVPETAASGGTGVAAVGPSDTKPLVIELPLSDATSTEPPVAESPVAEAAVGEAPVAKAPVAKAPVAKAPVAKAPVAKAPVAKAPVAKAPVAEAPVTESPGTDAPAPETPAPPGTPPVRSSANAPRTDAPDTTPGAPAAPERATPHEAPEPPHLASLRREVLDLQRRLPNLDHFEVLGLSPGCSGDDVRRAHVELVKRYHPDAHGGRFPPELHDSLETILMRVGQAWQVLSDAGSRAAYERRLHPERGGARRAPAEETEDPYPEDEPSSPSRFRPEASLTLAQQYMEKERCWEAIRVLEGAVPRLELRWQQHRGRVLLAQAYSHNPKWLRRAEEELRIVVREAPECAEAHYQLGLVYKKGGLAARARAMFRRALELKPGHRQAAAELGQEAVPANHGFLRRLFRPRRRRA